MYNILVNKNNPLNKNYIPKKLIKINNNYSKHIDNNYQLKVVKKVYKQFNKMQKKAFALGYLILIDSGYRSYEYQQKLLNNCLLEKGDSAYKTVALPGTSEHQTGLAIDIAIINKGNYIDEINDNYEETKWLHNNSYKYGFILRYPKNKQDITGYTYEPWHFRYVGKKSAKYLYLHNLALEEYKKNIIN